VATNVPFFATWIFARFSKTEKANGMTNGAGPGLVQSEKNLSQLRGYQARLDSGWSYSPADAAEMVGIIDSALAVPAPDGSPASIMNAASAYDTASSAYTAFGTSVRSAVSRIAGSWTGTRAHAVTAVFSALLTASEEEAKGLSLAGLTLLTWGLALRDAQEQDSRGRSELKLVREAIGSFTGTAGDILGVFESVLIGDVDLALFEGARFEARNGIASMVSAANIALTIGGDVVSTLTQLPSRGGSWLTAMNKAVQAAEQAHDITGSRIDAAQAQHVITLLQSAVGKLTTGLSGTEVTSAASVFGSDVAPASLRLAPRSRGPSRLKSAYHLTGDLSDMQHDR
jgi:hypothetical protein